MSPLHIVEVRPDLSALMRFLQVQGLDTGEHDEDLGYALHAWWSAAFGPLAPRPWRLLLDRHRPPRVLAYASVDAVQLRQHFREFAEPTAFAVCPDPDQLILSKPMPRWSSGRRLGFEVQCCPVGRKAGSGVEKDLFLLEADKAPERPLSREIVYATWARNQFEREGAAVVASIHLAGFRLIQQVRRTQADDGHRRATRLIRPQALLRGELTIQNPEAFDRLLARGIGRHRSFGYGMVLLRPPA